MSESEIIAQDRGIAIELYGHPLTALENRERIKRALFEDIDARVNNFCDYCCGLGITNVFWNH